VAEEFAGWITKQERPNRGAIRYALSSGSSSHTKPSEVGTPMTGRPGGMRSDRKE